MSERSILRRFRDVLFHRIGSDRGAAKRELGRRRWYRHVRIEPLEPRHLLSGSGPTITDVAATPALLNDANVGTAVLSVTVHFSEAMDLATIPTLAFSPELATTLTLNAGQSAWVDGDTYVAKYDVADASVKVDNVTVDVTGAKDGAGNDQEDYTPQIEFSVDTQAPLVTAATRNSLNPFRTAAFFRVQFSENVTGVDVSDFALTTTGVQGAAVMNVSGSGSLYTVGVATGTGNGTIRLDVVDNDSIRDGADNRLGGVGAGNGNFSAGQVWTIDKTGTIRGTVWNDLDADGVRDPGEPGIAGAAVFLDLDGDGLLDVGEPSRVSASDNPGTAGTDETGTYEFAQIEPGIYSVVEIPPEGFRRTFPGASYAGSGELAFVELHKDGVNGIDGLSGSFSVAVSPDNHHVYVGGYYDNALTVFQRDAASGALAPIQLLQDGVGGVNGLAGAHSVKLSPDGAFVYVAGFSDHALAVFARDASTGQLTFLHAAINGQNGISGMTNPLEATVSPDGEHIYVVGRTAVTMLHHDRANGQIHFGQSFAAGTADGLAYPYGVEVSPDGRHVYTVSINDDALTIFQRDAVSGQLTYVEALKRTDPTLTLLDSPAHLISSPDGSQLYVTAWDTNSLLVFNRDPATGQLTFAQSFQQGVAGARGLAQPDGITVSADGAHVYTASDTDSVVGVFQRDPASGLLQPANFIRVDETLTWPNGVTVSPDGKYLYATSTFSLSVFRRLGPPALEGAREIVLGNVETAQGIDFGNAPASEPRLTVLIAPDSVSENGGTAQGTVLLDAATAADLEVILAGSDPTEATLAGSVTIRAGENSATFTITAVNDTLLDGLQLVTVSASAAGFTSGSDTVTVLDDDTAAIRFAAPGSLAAEAAGTHAIAVQIEIPGGGMLEHDVSVDVVDALSGTATASGLSNDYSFAAQTLTFPAGSTNGTTRSVDLSIINDTRVEGGQTIEFSLDNLADGTGGQVTLADWGGATALTHVADVDGTARDAYGDGVFEQLTTTEPTVTTAKLQPPRDQDRSLFEFDVSTIPDNATVLSATLKLTSSYRTGGYPAAVLDLLGYAGDGQLMTADASVSTTVVGNVSITSLTTYSIPIDAAFVQSLLGTATHVGIATRLISGASVTFHSTEAVRPTSELPTLEIHYTSSGHSVTISDDDTAEVSFANVASSVGESAGSHALDVQLTITGNGTIGTGTLERAVSIDVRDQMVGTTSHPSDYSYGNPKTVTFAAGSTSGVQTVSFAVHEDNKVEGDETDLFDLANLQDGTSGQVSVGLPQTHTVTILDNDTATLSFERAESSLGEATTPQTVKVKLSIPGGGSLERAVWVDIADLLTGSATPDDDYTYMPQTVGFYVPSYDGDTHSVAIAVLDDALLEGDEVIEFGLTNLTGLPSAMVSVGLPDRHTVTILDDEVNTTPRLAPVGNRPVAERTALTLTVSGTDTDLPVQTLIYSASGLPTGATFDPATRQFHWTPAEDQGPGSYDVTFTVSDGSLSAAETITITVDEVNAAPTLNAIGNKTVTELHELTFTATAADWDLPANALTYRLVNAPAGAMIDAATGVFTWTPSEGQGPADHTFTVTVTDNGTPALSDEEQITVTVIPSVWKYVDVAASDSHAYGTVSGLFLDTHSAGDGVQSVREELYDKSRRTRLEHAWTFDVTGGDVGVSFHVLAGHDSTKETFRFEYDAQDGLGWLALVTLTANAMTSYTVALPPSLSGQLLVRVLDTDRSRNEKVIDSMTIDQMYFLSRRSTSLPPTIEIRASDSAAAETGPNAGQFVIELVDGQPHLTDLMVRYETSGTAGAGDYEENFSNSVVLPAGQLSVALPVTPVDDALEEGSESLTITLLADPAYVVATRAATIDIADNDLSLFVAWAESHQYGTLSGSYLATQQADGQMQRLTEELYSAGGKKSRLEHRWSFDLTGETSLEFQVTARHLTSGDPDNFQFQISTDGGTAWTPLVTATPTSPPIQVQAVTLPGAVGTVLVRVIDTDGSQDRRAAAIDIDQLLFRRLVVGGAAAGMPLSGSAGPLSTFREGTADSTLTEAAPAAASATLRVAVPTQGQAAVAEEDSPKSKSASSRKEDSVVDWASLVDTLLADDDDPLWA